MCINESTMYQCFWNEKDEPNSNDLTFLFEFRYLRHAMLAAQSARVIFLTCFPALSTCSVRRQQRHMTGLAIHLLSVGGLQRLERQGDIITCHSADCAVSRTGSSNPLSSWQQNIPCDTTLSCCGAQGITPSMVIPLRLQQAKLSTELDQLHRENDHDLHRDLDTQQDAAYQFCDAT